jgi:putative tryptophan/tyrosine transport system substrate-binding protein
LRRLFFLILALLLTAGPAAASEVLVVQSVRSPMYDDALKGFRSVCPAESRTIVLSDYVDAELARVIREEQPRLVLAVGDGALSALRKLRRPPTIALMALGLPHAPSSSENLTGVDLSAAPGQYLALLQKLKARRIGIVHDPAKTGWYLKLARVAARQLGLELVVREVSNPRQTIGQLDSLKGAVDSLWLLPDTTAVTMETLEAYFLFSQRESIPLVSFSAAHLKLGALLALELDRTDQGRQAGELALQVLQGASPARLEVAAPRKVSVKFNDAIAKRLNYPAGLISSLSKK